MMTKIRFTDDDGIPSDWIPEDEPGACPILCRKFGLTMMTAVVESIIVWLIMYMISFAVVRKGSDA